MPSKSRLFSQLIASSGQIKAEKLSDDISTIEQVSSADNLSSVGNVIGDQRVVGNTLYIWNGSGWYRIALINETPTWESGGQPFSSYILDADSPQDATVITLSASDPDGLPITYSYVTSGSMDSMATISQDSSVFTITPKTVLEVGEGITLTGSITFRASDGVNILPSVSSFTLNFITTIENSKYTTLLATAVDTLDNNNITDSSTNNHTITVTGDAHAGTFSPYRHGGYSWDFEGGTNAVSGQVTEGEGIVAYNNSSDYNVGTNDYSIECWFKHRTPTTYTTNENFRICEFNDIPNGGSNDRISLQHNNVGNINVKENGSTVVTTTSTPCDGEWHFIQVVRTGGTTAVYVDGTQEASASSSTNIGAISRIVVGAWYEYNYGFDGQIADFRFSNTARTAGTPTERLTSDSNTKLLVCTKPYLVDESGTATSLSLAKSTNRSYPSTKPFAPYDNLEYSATDHGGSIILDGSDNLKISSSSDFAYGTGDFTVEFWFYYTGAVPTNNNAFFWLQSGTNPQIALMLRTTTLIPYAYAPTQGDVLVANTAITPNTWQHHAMVRQGNTLTLYLDGNSIGSTTYTSDISSSAQMNIGSSNNNVQWVIGSLADFRVVKGTAVYTGNFTPPTGPLTTTGGTYPSTTNVNTSITAGHTKLFLKGTDASIIDKSQGSNLKLVGNTTGSTAQVKFANTKSMYFDGSGDYVTISDLELSGDLTIEGWFYQSVAQSATFRCLTGSSTYTSPGSAPLRIYTNGSDIRAYVTSTTYISGSFTANSWFHVALVRSSGTWTLYIDGVSAGTSTTSGAYNFASNTDWYIGASGPDGYPFTGYSQDVRFSNGLARYTANFTPPTESFKG